MDFTRRELIDFGSKLLVLASVGATLEQIKQVRVTADYDDRYGANSGPWTTEMFVEAVYQSLKK